MFEDFFAAVTVLAVVFFVYKWFELMVLKKERLSIVERLEGNDVLEYAKRLLIGVKCGGVPQETKNSRMVHPVGKVLRWGLFCIGIGVGIITAIACINSADIVKPQGEMLIGGWILLCGGISLVLSFVIEYFLCKKNE